MKRIINGIAFLLSLFSLASCNHNGYEENDGKIYHRWVDGGNWTKEYSLVEKADPATFEPILQNLKVDLGKDENNVFVNAIVIEHADPLTFEQIKNYYWRDENHVYLLNTGDQKYHIIEGAEPNSFTVISNHSWARDKNNVFYMSEFLPNVQASEFQALDKNWGKDNTYYFYHNFRLDSLDYHTAEIINEYYIKDKNHVFYTNKLVKGANPKTFAANKLGYFGHDDKNMFNWEKNKGPITEEYRNIYINK